uniref:Phosphoglycolate phosphatase n=1 Tax=Lygus hesperus TaxID=30085 RepID=A0A0A9XHV2_LYGHE
MSSAPKEWSSLTKDEKKGFISSLDSVVSDCDGVLWLGSRVLPGATDVMNGFKKLGKSIFFLTNNSTKSVAELTKKCIDMGFDTNEEEAIGTARLTALYLKSIKFNKKAYVIGHSSLAKELEAQGIQTFGIGPDVFQQQQGETIDLMNSVNGIKEGVGAVVVGYDLHFSYPKLQKACTYLADPECLFIATNTDERFPLPGGVFAPGCGSFVAAVAIATGRDPIVMGKPSPYAIDLVLRARGLNPERSLMIGDRCDTDIAFGNSSNMKTLLVLTGVTNEKLLKEYEKSRKLELLPTVYTPAIVDLVEIINEMIDQAAS